MAVKLAINGFGRIGRNILRAIVETGRTDVEVIAINDLGSVDSMAHLLRYDTVHGRFPNKIETGDGFIDVGLGKIGLTAIRDPAELPWPKVDVALECTGIFTSKDKAAKHLANGSSKVLVSAPASGCDKTIVYGVNHRSLTDNDQIVSNASCTTNCLSPVAKVLFDSVGIERGFMTTIHSYTGDQPVLDTMHKDKYRSRAASLSMIPTSTGAARAVGLVLPELDGKLDGVAIRVPTPNVSVVDLTFIASRPTSPEEINSEIEKAAEGELKGVLGYTFEPLVSSDFNHDPHSSIFHMDQTKVVEGSLCRILTWYDNEWGFSNRMADVAAVLGSTL
ncbi:MAG: type I glyceraldehyde-3-phosphate dehydrogenase [Albidovulum sp.]|nr:type I glyceraldehyde-3-phosphate dehydrogenase [Albidovulum sp.]MDE0531242.1 type I glyceraldehyde-3-phosphate dehydrogenase [Albidovulum sp.]